MYYQKHRNNCTFLRTAVTSKAKQTSALPRQVQAKRESTQGLCWAGHETSGQLQAMARPYLFIAILGYVMKSELVMVLFSPRASQTEPFSFLFHRSKLKPLAAPFTVTSLWTYPWLSFPRLGPTSAALVSFMPFACAISLYLWLTPERCQTGRYLNAGSWELLALCHGDEIHVSGPSLHSETVSSGQRQQGSACSRCWALSKEREKPGLQIICNKYL